MVVLFYHQGGKHHLMQSDHVILSLETYISTLLSLESRGAPHIGALAEFWYQTNE